VAATRSGKPSRIWPRSGSMLNGLCSPRVTLGRRTSGIGSSSLGGAWPTPRAEERQQYNSADPGMALSRAVLFWPTPTASDANSAGSADYSTESGRHTGTTLTDAIRKLWATPTAQITNEAEDVTAWHARRDRVKATGINGNGMGEPLTIQARSFRPAPATSTGGPNGSPPALVLNPQFVEALMGYPVGWTVSTGSEPLETPWSRCRQALRSACSRIASALISGEVQP